MLPAVQRATTPTMAAQTTPGYPGGTLVPPGVVPGAHEGHPIGPDGGGGAASRAEVDAGSSASPASLWLGTTPTPAETRSPTKASVRQLRRRGGWRTHRLLGSCATARQAGAANPNTATVGRSYPILMNS